jgi:regulator of extracellular matrix RemA (YlzA/DUF370 family)
MILHAILLTLLAGLTVFLFWLGFQQVSRGLLFLYLILGAILLIPLAIVGYRFYSLLRASYEIDRDQLSIRWGLRIEQIPLPEIEWVRPLDELGEILRTPLLSMPGAYLGTVKSPNLGEVEFMASNMNQAVVIASNRIVVVVSPEEPSGFVRAFQDAAEMGSLATPDARSSHPGVYVSQVFKDRLAMILLIALTLSTVALTVMNALLVLGRETISLGFAPNGSLLEPVPSSYLLLLPVLGLIIYFSDLAAGLFFFPRANKQLASYLVWAAGILSMVLLITASLILYFSAA